MTYYEVRRVEAEPALAFQAACNACQRVGMRLSGLHVGSRVAVYARGPHFKRGSVGEFVTVRVWEGRHGTRVGLEGTPWLGPWSRSTVDRLLDDVSGELRDVLAAPAARLREIEGAGRVGRPFGQAPRALALAELMGALLVWGLVVGGPFGVFATLMAATHAVLIFVPRRGIAWRSLAFGTALLHIPTGALGFVAGRMALLQALWPRAAPRAEGPPAGTIPVIPPPGGAR